MTNTTKETETEKSDSSVTKALKPYDYALLLLRLERLDKKHDIYTLGVCMHLFNKYTT